MNRVSICIVIILLSQLPDTYGQLSISKSYPKPSVNNYGDLKLKKLTLDKEDPKDTSKSFGDYVPNGGFGLVNTDLGTVRFKVMTYMRYLNQKGLNESYTNTFGRTSDVKNRQDIQINKVNISFFGWFLDPAFRYLLYVWTQNVAQGLSAQVVVAGNLNYTFSEYLTLGAGIDALPGTRSTTGNFPYWLSVDNRLISDEYFRPSFTTAIWAKGNLTKKLTYHAMLGNNISQLGIDAGQLDNGLNTFSGVISWFPTTGEFGLRSNFGDFEDHLKVATRLSGHFSFSGEDRQSQPKSADFDNVTLRVSDGSPIFTPELFGVGINIEKATYKMTSVDAGFKFKGFALEGEYFYRWLSNFTGDGVNTLNFNLLTDNGFQLMASHMVIQQRLQFYSTFSQVFGDYGNPWDARLGLNFFPFKTQSVRWNFQYTYTYKSPVGGLSFPYAVGGTGSIFNTDFLINF
jgi:hypothetical protein